MESPKFCFFNLLSIFLSDHLQSLLIRREPSTSEEMRAILDQFALSLSPPSPRYYKVDLRTITLGVPPQEVEVGIEKDSFFE